MAAPTGACPSDILFAGHDGHARHAQIAATTNRQKSGQPPPKKPRDAVRPATPMSRRRGAVRPTQPPWAHAAPCDGYRTIACGAVRAAAPSALPPDRCLRHPVTVIRRARDPPRRPRGSFPRDLTTPRKRPAPHRLRVRLRDGYRADYRVFSTLMQQQASDLGDSHAFY